MLPLQAEGPLEARLPEGERGGEAVFSVSPAEKITTSNRFSLLGQKTSPIPAMIPAPPVRLLRRQPPLLTNWRPSPVPTLVRRHPIAPQPPVLRSTGAEGAHSFVAASGPASGSCARDSPQRALIKLAGFIGSCPAVILVDSGATGNFVASKFASKARLALTAGPPSTATLANGQPQDASGVACGTPVRIGSYTDRIDFNVTDLGGYDAILGMRGSRSSR